LRQKFRTDKPI
jgi:hypothetical protein